MLLVCVSGHGNGFVGARSYRQYLACKRSSLPDTCIEETVQPLAADCGRFRLVDSSVVREGCGISFACSSGISGFIVTDRA